MITRFTYEYYIKVQSISACSNSLKYLGTLYLHDIQKLASVPYSSLSN